MRCPSCDRDIVDEDAAFCPRCGSPLGSPEVEATGKLPVGGAEEGLDDPTADLRDGSATGTLETPGAGRSSVVRDFVDALRTGFVSGWLEATSAASLAFLVLLCVGAALLLAAKLQFPAFGAGANPIEVLTAIAILGLGVLRAPIHLGNVTIVVLPFGALLAAGLGIVWACRLVLRRHATAPVRQRAAAGARVAIPFALICWIAALSFRFRGEEEVFAGAWGALIWAAVWGALFGALSGIFGVDSLTQAARARLRGVVPEGAFGAGIVTGAVMLVAVAVLAAGMLLLGIIAGLARGTPTPSFGVGDAIAAIVYLVAFGPNLVAAVVSLGMGSAIDVGARVTVAGSRLGSVKELSLFSWGNADAPWYAFVLVLIPLAGTLFGGFYARRTAPADRSPVVVLGTAAALFAVTLFTVSLLGDARLGGGLAGRGLAHVSIHPFRTLFAALLWSAAGGFAGWKLAERTGAARDGGIE